MEGIPGICIFRLLNSYGVSSHLISGRILPHVYQVWGEAAQGEIASPFSLQERLSDCIGADLSCSTVEGSVVQATCSVAKADSYRAIPVWSDQIASSNMPLGH